MMKRVYTIAAAFVVLGFGCRRSPDEPVDALRRIESAVQGKDMAVLRQQLSAATHKRLDELEHRDSATMLELFAELLKLELPLTTRRVEISGDSATIEISGQRTDRFVIRLVRERDHWKWDVTDEVEFWKKFEQSLAALLKDMERETPLLLDPTKTHLLGRLCKRMGRADETDELDSSPYVDVALPSDRETDEAIRQAMEKQVTLDFKDVPLNKAMAEMADKAGIKIRINEIALAEEGIATDERISLSLPVPIHHRFALELLLEPLGLAWVMKDDAIVVTTEIGAEEMLTSRYYSVRKLQELGFSLQALESLIRSETGGPWLMIDGTGGRIDPIPGVLAVRQTGRVHRQIRDVLKTLERVGSGGETSGFAALLVDDRAAYDIFHRKVSLSLDDIPISQLPAPLQKAASVNFIVDYGALAEEGIEPETTVSIHVKDVPLRIALTKVLEPLDMTLVAHRGVVIITTKITAEERLDTLLYNIRDFVEASYDVDMMSDLIQSATWGPWSDIDGTGGTITPLEPGFLVVRQTMRNHRQAAAALNRVRTLLRKTSPDGTLPQAIVSDELIVKYYMMRDRVPEIEGKANGLPVEQVRDAIPKFVAPKSWKINGGRGDISVVNSTLVIRQTARVHRKVRRFLQTLRRETLIQFLTGDTPLSDPAPTTPAP